MPSTTLYNFASSEIRMRWREPYLTEGLNQRGLGTISRGVYRGYRLDESVGLLSVTLKADVDRSDHVAAVELANGYVITLRQSPGDITLDLTAYANKTVVIALFGTYVTGVDTTAQIRVYELSPTDDFTGDPDKEYLTVLGTVVVPAAGVIPAANIRATYRTAAWQKPVQENKPWTALVKNPVFAEGPDGVILGDRELPHWVLEAGTATHFEIVAGAGPGGKDALLLDPDTAAVIHVISVRQPLLRAVRPGQLLRWRVVYKCDGVPTLGTLEFIARFADTENSPTTTSVVLHSLDITAVTADYVTVEGYVAVPAGNRNLYQIGISGGLEWAGVANGILIAEAQVWADDAPEYIPAARFGSALLNYAHWRMEQGVEAHEPAEEAGEYLALDGGVPALVLRRVDQDDAASEQPKRIVYGQVEAGYAGLNVAPEETKARYVAWYNPGRSWQTLFAASPKVAGATSPFRLYQGSNIGGESGFAFVLGASLSTSTPYNWDLNAGTTRALRVRVMGSGSNPTFAVQQNITGGNEATWTNVLVILPSLAGIPTMTFTGKLLLGSGLVGSGEELEPRLTYGVVTGARTLITYAEQGSVTVAEYVTSGGLKETVVNAVWNGTQWVRSSAADAARMIHTQGGVIVHTYPSASPSPWNDTSWLKGNISAGSIYLQNNGVLINLSGDSTSKDVRITFVDFVEPAPTDAIAKNSIYAKTITKAMANVTTGGAAVLNSGLGIASVAMLGTDLEITLQHAITGGGNAGCIEVTAFNFGTTPAVYQAQFNPAGTKVLVSAYTTTTGAVLDLAATAQTLMVVVKGPQA